jgi:phosphatidylserine/phosphatidylglycerophosphate/cardiolipin synthase-like enzyme
MKLLAFLCLFISVSAFADKLIIEPDMGKQPLLNAINHTKQSIHLVMYGFTDEQLLNALAQQKQRGKSLKIILENNPYKAAGENTKAIQSLESSHIDLQSSASPFRFIHQKTLIIDGREAIVMTFNFTKSTFKHERNFALIIDDPQKVNEIDSVFSSDWNHKSAPHQNPELIYSPDDSRAKLLNLISNAKQTIKIYAQTISDYKIVGALAKAARDGIEVDILTSSSLRTKQAAYLKKAGVILHQSNHYYIHAKVFIFDNQQAVIGSINLTRASLDDNRELAVITRDASVIKQLNATFMNDWPNAISIGKALSWMRVLIR